MTGNVKVSDRIMSVDALRGFDMLMIIIATRFFRGLNQGADIPLALRKNFIYYFLTFK